MSDKVLAAASAGTTEQQLHGTTATTTAKVCAICLDTVRTPNVTIPACGHTFCSDCFEGWRCKYHPTPSTTTNSKKSCPQCRTKIPPTKEMLHQLDGYRKVRAELQDFLDHPPYPTESVLDNPGVTGVIRWTGAARWFEDELPTIRSLPTFELQQEAVKKRCEDFIARLDREIDNFLADVADDDSGDVLVESGVDLEDLPAEMDFNLLRLWNASTTQGNQEAVTRYFTWQAFIAKTRSCRFYCNAEPILRSRITME
jgi:Ring finger domain